MRRFLLFIFFLFVNVSLFADNIEFANDNVKAACVAKWDTDKDGELSYDEAAAVTSLVDKDDANDPFAQLWAWADGSDFSFDEFQYFTGVTSLAGHEFECENLTSIILPNSITSIGRGTFYYCKKLTSIHIPASVTAIYMGSSAPAFNPKYLQTITVDPNNTKYASPEGSNAIIAIFDEKPKTLILGCGNTDFTKIPNTVTTIGQDAFSGVTFANPIISLPTSVTGIMGYAFMHSNITSINLGELSNLTTIGNQAFSDCTGLTEVTLPASITSMGISVFANCYNIVKVVSNIEEPFNNDSHYYSIYYYIFTIYNDAVLYVPTGKVQAYIDKGWKEIDGEFQSFRVITDDNSTDPVIREGLVYGDDDIWMDPNKGQRLIFPGTYRDGMMEYSLDGSTYSTSVPLGIDAGEYTVYYRKVGESGVSTLSATIAPKTVSSPTITLSQTSYTYDGTAKEPTVTVKDGETTISAEEYTVGYSNNTNAGTATVTITDKTGGNYAVSGSKTFTINTKTVSSSTITLSQTSYTYDGTAKEPTVTVKDGETTISPEEYIVGYSNNTNVGTATVTITDKEGGNYNVSGSTTFTIAESGESVEPVVSGVLIYSINPDDNTFSVTGHTDECAGNIIIPASVDGRSVTSIGSGAFKQCYDLTSVTIPNSVTCIGDSAFYWCSGMTSMSIPNSVTSIGDCAFNLCSGLTSLIIPNSVTSIGNHAFKNCIKLTSVSIPNSVTFIGECAFQDCKGLTSVTIPNSVTCIGDSAFLCSGLTSVRIPSSVTSIGNRVFYWCEGLTSVTIPNSVISIGDYAFFWCRSLTSVTIPNSVTSIGEHAFRDCDNLTSVTIGNSVTSIGECAFSGCGLTSVTIPNSVTSLGDAAFACQNLTSVTVESKTPLSINSVFSHASKATLYVPVGSRAAYAAATGWSWFKNIIQHTDYIDEQGVIYSLNPDGQTYYVSDHTKTLAQVINILSPVNGRSVTSIGEEAFKNCQDLTSVTIGTSVTSIGSSTFKNCSSLTSVIIPRSVTSIGDSTFYYCENLTSLTIPNSVKSIGNFAFYYCKGLTSSIPNSVESIGNYAFYNCYGLTSSIPNSVKSIGNFAFYNCDDLTSVTIPSSVTFIGEEAFTDCGRLSSIVVDSDNKDYDSRNNCNAIIKTASNTLIVGCKTTVIPNGVTSIGNFAFYKCGFTSLAIPNSVTSIGSNAFEQCYNLTSVAIPNSVTSIGDYAFFNCEKMASVIIGTSVTSIGERAFGGCKLASVTIPNSVTSIGERGFYCFNLKTVTVEAKTPFAITRNTFPISIITLYVPAGCKEAYETADNWKYIREIISMGSPIGKTGLVYTGSFQDLLTEGSSPSIPYLYSTDGTNFGSAIPQGKKAREYTVYYKEEGSTTTNSIKVTIAKAPLKITAKSYVRKEREANPEFGVTYEGFKNNETEALLTTKPTVTCAATKDSPAGTYDITVSGAVAGNYEISYVAGTLTIEAAPKPLPEPKGTTFDVDTDDSSTKEVKVTFVVKESDSSGTPTVAISDDKDASGSVAIPEAVTHNGVEYKVTEISEGAFQNNTSLTEVKIPASITSIGANAFAGCKNLQEITINIIVPINLAVVGARGFTRATGDDVFEGVNKETCILYVPAGSVDAYKAAPVWKEFKHILPIKTSTGIQGVVQTDGEPFDVFNLSGQKVKSNATSLDGLPRGIYIINGKKVMK